MAQIKKSIVCLLVIVAVNSGIAQPSDSYIQNLMYNAYFPGTEAAVIKEGKWMWDRAWGYADIPNNIPVQNHHIFTLGSVSKTLVATALMQLWEQGAFQLDDDINLYLPFYIYHPAYPNDTITIRMLTAHTSGLTDDWGKIGMSNGDSPISTGDFLFDYFDPSGALYDTASNFGSFQPGTDWEYSNVGTTLAAYIVELLSGMTFDQYCDLNIFQPLCMENASFTLSGIADTSLIVRPYSWDSTYSDYYDNGLVGFPVYSAGLMRAPITSLARFMSMYMQYGSFEGTTILDSTTVAMMMTTQFPSVPNAAGQGIFFYEHHTPNGDTLWGHAGGMPGVSTNMFFNYGSETGIIVLANGDTDNGVTADLIMDTLYSYGQTLTVLLSDTFPACQLTTSISEAKQGLAQEEISLFPNPAKEILYIELKNTVRGVDRISVLNAWGVKVLEENRSGEKSIKINVNHLPPGVYMCRLNVGSSGRIFRFVKN